MTDVLAVDGLVRLVQELKQEVVQFERQLVIKSNRVMELEDLIDARIKDVTLLAQHRDAWRAYAYGKGPRPDDFLGGARLQFNATRIELLERELEEKSKALESALKKANGL